MSKPMDAKELKKVIDASIYPPFLRKEAKDFVDGLVAELALRKQAQRDTVDATQKTVEAYASAARAIALWTDKYCNKDLPYDEMIAQAVRDMVKDSEAKDAALEAARGELDVHNIFAEQFVETLKTADELVLIAEEQAFRKGIALRLLGIDVYDITPEMVSKHPELSNFDAEYAAALPVIHPDGTEAGK